MPFAERLEPRRLLAAGDLDLAFGAGGALDIDLTHPLFGAQRVVPIAGGDVLVVGQEIRRFTSNGTLDLTFGGGDGVIPLPDDMVAANDYIENAAVLPNGNVIALVRIPAVTGDPYRQIIAFDANGAPLAPPGALLAQLTDIDDFVVQPDGNVLALGALRTVRFTADLALDTSFAPDGDPPGLQETWAIDVAPDGSVFASGLNNQTPPKHVIVKVTPTGALDAGFGNNGEVVITNPAEMAVFGLEAEAGGSVLTVASGKIRRLKADGQFDSSFGVGGVADPTFGDIGPWTTELRVVPGGKILVTEGKGVTRLNPDGSIDSAYGRVVISQPGAGLPTANEWGEVYFTAAGATRTLALHRLAADNPTPGPIHLDAAGQLVCIGTDNADEMRAANQNGDLVVSRNRADVARVFNPADVTMLNFQGLGGNDFITLASAGWFRTTVSGGDGNDKILGCDGPDSIGGNAGKDFISGGSGADRLAGHGGRDKLIGEGGADRCYGGSSGDWLIGGGGNDQLFGDGGNDYISGGSGTDSLDGAMGDDLLISNDAAIAGGDGYVDYLWGDGGQDRSIADPNDVLSSIEFKLDPSTPI